MENIAHYLEYDPLTGLFKWKLPPPSNRRIKPGDTAGTIAKTLQGDSYLRIDIFKKRYPASHVAWFIMTGEWPTVQVDHRNKNTLDNQWTNLRLATPTQNQANRGRMRNNTSGYKGVSPTKQGRWIAQINHRHIGTFSTAEEAARAYDTEAIKLHQDFAQLNFTKE